MPSGHRRSEFDEPEPEQPSPITPEEAYRRHLWGVFRIHKASYLCAKPGVTPVGCEWVAWAVDEESALRACVERGRDERYPASPRLGLRRSTPTHAREAR